MNIESLRNRIDMLDAEILALLRERLKITTEMGKYKKENYLPIFDKNREMHIFQKMAGNFPEDPVGIQFLWKELMSISKRNQQNIVQNFSKNTIKIGIQWGEWSFNHIAIREFLAQNPGFSAGKNIEIIYLYTTESVLENLNNGAIDFGQFAIANSIGGLVHETLATLGDFHWKYVEDYTIAVKHSLFLYPDTKIEEIDTIMWHEQAIRQCEKNLQKFFPKMKLVGGTGDLTDNSAIAKSLSDGVLSKNIACIGNKILGDIFSLSLYRENLQDREDNETTFVLVKL